MQELPGVPTTSGFILVKKRLEAELELLARQVVVDVLIHQSLPQHAGGDKQHRRIERRMCRRTTSPLPFIRTSARKHADLLPAGSLQDV